MKRSANIVAALLLLTCCYATGQTNYVSHWGSHTPPYDTWETAATNLNDAINAIADNGTVMIESGIYRDGAYDDGNISSRARVTRGITLQSVSGSRRTVIEGAFHSPGVANGTNAVRALLLEDGVVDGFTIRKGATANSGPTSARTGGGVRAEGGTIMNSRISGNHGYTAGGGWLDQTTLSNVIFSANQADTGPRVKVGSQVKMHDVKLHADGNHFPDLRIIGTNAQAITNGDYLTSLDLGTDYGLIHALTGSLTHTFTVTNQGTRDLVIEDIAYLGGDTNDWQVLSSPATPLLPGESAPLEILFDPESPGMKRTLLFLANNDPDDDPFGIWLTGESIQAEMLALATNGSIITNESVTPLVALGTDFGDVRLTDGPATRSYVITNIGTATLNLSSIYPTELDTNDFYVTLPTNYPSSIAPGATGLVTVAFDPLEVDYRATILHFESDAANNPYRFGIMGRGVEPYMQIGNSNDFLVANDPLAAPSLINSTDFGEYVSTAIENTFNIHNVGTYPLSLTGTPTVVVTGLHSNDFTVTQQPADTTIEPGSNTQFKIKFVPHATGLREALVQIQSDDVYYTNTLYQFAIQGYTDSTNLFASLPIDVSDVTAGKVAWIDVDADGLLDLITMGNSAAGRITELYYNLGGGAFTNIPIGMPGFDAGDIEPGDFNHDGLVDIAIAGMTSSGAKTLLFINNGDLTFTDAEAGLTGVYNGALAWGDMDNDGDLDLFACGYTASGSTSVVYRNNGDATFTDIGADIPPMRDSDAAWIDVDEDGWNDIIVSGLSNNGREAVLLRNTQGTFTQTTMANVSGKSHGGISISDINADGTDDLATTGFSDTGQDGQVYVKDSSTNFVATTSLPPLWLGTVETGDLNNNGWPDLMVNGANILNERESYIYMNSAGVLNLWPSSIPGLRVSSIALGDCDNDGDLDIALVGFANTGPYGAINRNLSPTANTAPSTPGNLQVTLTNGNEAIFSWTAAADDSTPVQSLTYNIYVGTTNNQYAIVSPNANIASGKRYIASHGNIGSKQSIRLRNLPAGETITWGVQAIDSTFTGGAFSNAAPFVIPLLPDFAISDIEIRPVPFAAFVTVTNQGNSAGIGGNLAVWLNRPTEAAVGSLGDLNIAVSNIAAYSSETFEFNSFTFPTETTTNIFRAYINSEDTTDESYSENNQATVEYVYTVYEPFWFKAVALTNSVYLRWIDPQRIGMDSSEVLIRHATNAYPTVTTDGALLYNGTNQVIEHTSLTQDQTYFYTIWVTHDGTEWFVPPDQE